MRTTCIWRCIHSSYYGFRVNCMTYFEIENRIHDTYVSILVLYFLAHSVNL